MPAALEIDHEQVKCVAVQIGFREAARQFGISEDTLCSWARREGWMEQIKQAQAAVALKQEKQGLQAVARKSPAEILLKLGNRSRLRAAKVGDKTLKGLEKRQPEQLIASSGHYLNTVNALAKVHGWGSEGSGHTTAVQVNLTGVRFDSQG